MTSAERALAMYRKVVRSGTGYTTRLIKEDLDAAVAEALPRWVPVGERLPDNHNEVLVTADDGIATFGSYSHGAWHVYGGEAGVIAWQPLPAPWVALSKKEG